MQTLNYVADVLLIMFYLLLHIWDTDNQNFCTEIQLLNFIVPYVSKSYTKKFGYWYWEYYFLAVDFFSLTIHAYTSSHKNLKNFGIFTQKSGLLINTYFTSVIWI